jgi:hypothetical protein
LIDEQVPSSQFIPAGALAPNSTFYWRVQALNAAGEYSAWSTAWVVKTLPAAPALVAPGNELTLNTLRPTFDWEDAPGALSYTLLVSTSSTFTTYLINQQVTASTVALNVNLVDGQTYYWKVLVRTANGNSAWSGSWKFTLDVP